MFLKWLKKKKLREVKYLSDVSWPVMAELDFQPRQPDFIDHVPKL